MAQSVTQISNWSYKQLEASLLPVQGGLIQKTACYAYQFFQFCLFLPVAATSSIFSCTLNILCAKPPADPPLVAFAKHPEWDQQPLKKAPVKIGFATADFQENGPREHPKTNWSEYYKKNAHQLGPLGKTPDIWNHPGRVLERLLELGVKKFRFSVSRDKIEPKAGHPFDPSALQHYRNFCRMLQHHGIEPMATLHHFSDPTYFSWRRKEDIDGFVRYAQVVAAALYKEGVRKIITINEPTIVAFQGWGRGDFPPEKTMDFVGVAEVLENMMSAHTRVYKTLKVKYPHLQIGIAHDPIRFRHYHKWHPIWTPIERILCYYLTEINHSALMRFFQTGKFSLQIPFCVNHHFELPSKPPLDFFALQYYTDPSLKLSVTGGGSVTRIPGENLSSLGYRAYPQGLASAIEECRSLGVPIDLTEIGFDIGINKDITDKERISYFQRIFQVVQKAIQSGIPVRSLYFWTLIDNLEWSKAWGARFGFYSFDPKTGKILPRPVTKWLKKQLSH